MRTIHLNIAGDTVQADSTVAGVQGSGNVDKLVVRFDASWDGYAKWAAWWDAHGVQAGEPRLLTAELLEDGPRDLRSYILVVPPEALRCAGTCTLAINGWTDLKKHRKHKKDHAYVGALGRTVRQEFRVAAAPAAAVATSVTPSQAQQLQHEIEELLGGVAGSGAKAAREAYIAKCWAKGEPEQGTTYVKMWPGRTVNVSVGPVDGATYRFYWNGENGEETAEAVCVDGYVSAGWLEWYTDKELGLVVRNNSDKDLGQVTIKHVPYFQSDAPEEDRTGAWEWAKRAMAARDKAGEYADDAALCRDQALAAKKEANRAAERAADTLSDVLEAAEDCNDHAQAAQEALKEAEEARDEAAAEKRGVNLLDNWYLADPVNQRGQTTYAVNGHTIDRWRTWSDTISVTLAGDGVLLENSGATNGLFQYFEPSQTTDGPYTFSVLTADGNLHSIVSSGFSPNIVWGTSYLWGRISMLRPQSGKGNVSIRVNQGRSVKVVAVKLEVGDHQTLAHRDEDGNWVLNDPPPDRAVELAKCQRYYMEFNGVDDGGGAVLLGRTTANAKSVFLLIPTPVTMRAAPAVTISGDFSVWGTDAVLSYSGSGVPAPNGIEVFNVASDTTIPTSAFTSVEMMNGFSKVVLDANL